MVCQECKLFIPEFAYLECIMCMRACRAARRSSAASIVRHKRLLATCYIACYPRPHNNNMQAKINNCLQLLRTDENCKDRSTWRRFYKPRTCTSTSVDRSKDAASTTYVANAVYYISLVHPTASNCLIRRRPPPYARESSRAYKQRPEPGDTIA